MEWALFIPRAERIGLAEDPWGGPGQEGEARIIRDLFGPVRFTRIYFGQEFCERRLPGPGELAAALAEAGRRNMEFTLVTPFVTERGLGGVADLLRILDGDWPGSEVVVNDWGVLYLLSAKFPRIRPVLGRLLNKIPRDPRMGPCLPGKSGDGNLFRTCSLAGPHMKKLLKKMKTGRVELDNYFQGLDDGLGRWGYRVSLYVPHGCIATGRICLFGSWGLERERKFSATEKMCSRRCRFHRLELEAPGLPGAGPGMYSLFLRGNTVFYRQEGDFLAGGLERARQLGVDRIVYQPEPM